MMCRLWIVDAVTARTKTTKQAGKVGTLLHFCFSVTRLQTQDRTISLISISRQPFFFSYWMLQIAGAVEDTLIHINNPSVVQIFIYIEKQKEKTQTYCDIVTCATQMSLQPLHRNPIFTHAPGNQLSTDVRSHNYLMQIFTISVCQLYHLQTKVTCRQRQDSADILLKSFPLCRIKLRSRSFSSSSFFF